MHADIERVLIDRGQIARRIAELGKEIQRDWSALGDDAQVVLVPVLTGSIIFIADLMRELPVKMRISVVTSSSYPGNATKSVGARVVGALPEELEGKHVLVVDDVLDSGQTVKLIRGEIERRRPRSVRVAVLLRKRVASAMETACDYVGFDIPDEFVVGYGLDYDDYYRNLPDICTLRKEAM